MCGIFGVFRFNGSPRFGDYKSAMVESVDTLGRRGPDSSGFWSTADSACCFFHTRLSILDISDAGNQPFVTNSGANALCYNGEIYNFVELRHTLPYLDYVSNSDTEILHRGLVARGAPFIRELDGMFAFGFYSKDSHSLLLARDRMGQKPLYYSIHKGHFCFASDFRVFSKLPGFRFEFEVGSIADYLSFQQVPAPRTIFRNIFKLEPGFVLQVNKSGEIRRESYLDSFVAIPNDELATDQEAHKQLSLTMQATVERTLRADVDLGCFLSGGIDSSLASAFTRKIIGRGLKTFSVGFVSDPSCELNEARRISGILGTDHTEVMVYPTDYIDYLDRVIDQFDEPNSDPSCVPTFKVSEVAKQSVDVVLTGDGLDELFGGYSRYLASLSALKANTLGLDRGDWHLGIDYSRRLHTFHQRHIENLFGILPSEFQKNLNSFYSMVDDNHGNPLRSFMDADRRFYLPTVLAKVDKMTMAHGLEARSPFLSNEVIAMARGLSPDLFVRGATSKFILRRLFSELIDPVIASLPKKGFANSASNEMVVSLVGSRLRDRLGSSDSSLRLIFGADYEATVRPYLHSGNFYKIWSLLVLEEWMGSTQSKGGLHIDYL